jgi:hypothetical protein
MNNKDEINFFHILIRQSTLNDLLMYKLTFDRWFVFETKSLSLMVNQKNLK